MNPDLCDAGAVLYQLSYQANWEKVVMRVNYKPFTCPLLALICRWCLSRCCLSNAKTLRWSYTCKFIHFYPHFKYMKIHGLPSSVRSIVSNTWRKCSKYYEQCKGHKKKKERKNEARSNAQPLTERADAPNIIPIIFLQQ